MSWVSLLPLLGLAGGLVLVFLRVRQGSLFCRSFLRVHPRYRDFLRKRGLTKPEHFLDLAVVVISGHPDRQVARVTLEEGEERITAYLKREHHVPLKERLTNFWAGFG